MKNTIEFPENNIFESSKIINQTSAGSSFVDGSHSKASPYQNLKDFKIVKGKVKIMNNKSELKLAKSYGFDENTELEIVGKRMLLFMILTILFLLVFSLFMLL